MFVWLQLIALCLLPLFAASLIKNLWLRVVLSAVFSLFVCLQLTSLKLSGSFIDYQFYSHFNIDSIQAFAFQFKTQMLIFVAVCLLFAVVYALSAWALKRFKSSHRIALTVVMMVFLSLPSGAFFQLYKLSQTLQAEQKQFEQALSDVGIPPQEYVSPKELKASSGKNIIVLSLESFEQGFLNPPFTKITPNLSRLKQDWTFFADVHQSPGSKWTAGSIYTTQVGLPAFFNQHNLESNELFQSSSQIKLSGLGHVLNQANYSSKYILGKPEFAGMKSIIELFDIDIISESNSIGDYTPSQAGLHDLDVFNELKLQIRRHRDNSNQPFAFFASTINTHFPEGIYDRRMMQYVGRINQPLKYSIAATDYLVGDLLRFLQQEDLMEDTVVFIFPDHQLMGNSGPIINDLNSSSRKLYFLSNADPEKFSRNVGDKLFQADTPRLILEGAEIQTNVKFLRDFITADDFNDFLKQKQSDLASLNNASLKRDGFIDELQLTVDDQYLVLSSGIYQYQAPIKRIKGQTHMHVVFNQDMIPLSSQERRERVKPVLENNQVAKIHLFVELNKGQIKSSELTDLQGHGISQTESQRYSSEDIKKMVLTTKQHNQNLKNTKAQSREDRVAAYAVDPMRYIAHGGGEIDGKKSTNSLEALNLSYSKGYKLFELDIIETSDGHLVAAHDWKTWKTKTGFNGQTPPTLEQFLSTKIFDKYTPMDMPAINSWFEQHTDAILVTDKINDPQRVSLEFVDKNRLMMELFSWESIEAATSLGLRSILPTGDLLVSEKFKLVERLKKLGIRDLAMSRRWADRSAIVSLLKNAGFHIYAFHINFDPGKDEIYVTCQENDLFYGMYADRWDFNPKIKCD